MFYSLLARLLSTNTVDYAVASLNKVAASLAAAEAAQTKRAANLALKAGKLKVASDQAAADAARAKRVLDRLADLTA